MERSSIMYFVLLAATAVVFTYLLALIFIAVPTAQLTAGGLAQKIFYFHVPAAYAMYLSGLVCFVASVAYLLAATDRRDALAQAAAECAVLFGAMVLVSGPLWAKKAWGVYWTWEPRLTTSLLSVLVYVGIVVLRAFLNRGPTESKAAAALGVLGFFTLPLIHFAVSLWGGNHPTVIGRGGGGLAATSMLHALLVGLLAMTLLAALLIWSRAGTHLLQKRLDRFEQRALATDLAEGM
jgi:heme exporter protein C